MEENVGRNVPSSCRNELTRTNSGGCSALTAVCSENFSRRNVNSRSERPAVWTDEKHMLYLDSLEASFMNQLHHSTGLHDCLEEIIRGGPYSSRHLPTNVDYSLHQFMVVRDNLWKKIDFEGNEPLSERTADLNAPSRNRIHIGGNSMATCDGSAKTSTLFGKFHPCHCHKDSMDSTIEFSDQNFVEENQGEKSNCEFRAKRLKTMGTDALSYDRVISSGKSSIRDTATTCQFSHEGEEQVHR